MAKNDSSNDGSGVSVSDLFDDTSADLVFISSDDVRFYMHMKYVAANAEGLQLIASSSPGEVRLEERSAVISILFLFIRPSTKNYSQPPSASELDLDLFFEVAEAAEKYTIIWAVNYYCHPHMSTMAKQHPNRVLNYAVKGNHLDLAETAAQEALTETMDVVQAGLTYPGLLAVWLEYYGHWQKLARLGHRNMVTVCQPSPCPIVNRLGIEYCQMVLNDPRKVEPAIDYIKRSLSAILPTTCPTHCWCCVPLSPIPIDNEVAHKRQNVPSFKMLWDAKQQRTA